jgi:hypothetical protein
LKTNAADRIILLLTIPVGLMGVYVVAGFFQGIYRLTLHEASEDWWGTILAWLFTGLFMGSIVLGFCGLALHTAIYTWKQITLSRVRRLCACGAVALWGLLAGRFGYPYLETDSPGPVLHTLLGTGLLAACVGFYLILSRSLIARSSVGPEPPKPAARHWIGLVCFFFWLEFSSATQYWTRTQFGVSNDPDFGVELLEFFGPILAAWAIYKVTVYIVDNRYRRYEISTLQDPVPA